MLSRLSRLWSHLKVRLGRRFAGSAPELLRPTDIIDLHDDGDLRQWADRFGVETTELRDVLLDFEQASQRPNIR
jgi:hypothetical protein